MLGLGLGLGMGPGGAGGGSPSLASIVGSMTDRYALRFGGAYADQFDNIQAIAFDRTNDKLYYTREKPDGTANIISWVYANSGYAPGIQQSSADSVNVGHQTLMVEQSTGKLVVSNRVTNTGVIRGDFASGLDLANQQAFGMFTDVSPGASIYPMAFFCMSRDGVYLIGCFPTSAIGEFRIRRWVWATVVAGGPGDYSAAYDAQFSISGGSWPGVETSYPAQGILSENGSDIIFVAGFGSNGTDPIKVRRYSFTGSVLDNYSFTPYTQDWAATDSPGATANFEPEGLDWYQFPDTSAPVPVLAVATGGSGNRFARLITLGGNYRQTAAQMVTKLKAKITAIGGTISAGAEAAYLRFYQDILAFDGPRYLGSLWMLAAESEAVGRINVLDPFSNYLTKVGTPIFTAKVGARGTGNVADYYTPSVQWYKINGVYGQKIASFYCYQNDNIQSAGGCIGQLTGTYCFLNPRDASNLASTRSNQTTATNSVASTDSSGLWVVTRSNGTGYKVRRNGTQLLAPTETAGNQTAPNAIITFLRTASAASVGQLSVFGCGYDLPSTLDVQFKAAIETFNAAMAALP